MTGILSILSPIAITDAMFDSSTAPETDYTAWSGATTYAIGDRCINTTTHRIYESLRDTNLNKDPTDILNTTGTAPWWLDVDPTNKWAIFDGEVSTQTVLASPLTVVVTPGPFNSIYFGGLDADTLTVTQKDAPAGTTIYSLTASLEGSEPPDYYEWCFDPFRPMADYLITGLSPFSASEATISLTGTGVIKCGVMAFGDLRPLGQTLRGAKAKPKSYSYVKLDEFGKNKIVRRKKAKDVSFSAILDLAEANTVLADLTALMDVPCVVIGSDLPAYGGLRVFGLPNGEVSFDHPDHAVLNLSVEGLI